MRKTVRLIVLEKFNNLQYEQGENDFFSNSNKLTAKIKDNQRQTQRAASVCAD